MFSPENRAKAEGLVDRFPVKRSALLPLLHLVQYQDGYVSDDGVAECAELLELTKAEVAAVATFYTMYKREPMGRHLVSICTNFSCAVRGGKEVYDRVAGHLGVGHNQTTEDGAITLEHAECLGNCEGAPLISVDYINYEMVAGDAAIELVEALRRGEAPEPTRGMVPPGIREASHRLAAIGPIDPDAPGQRLGLATKEHGAVPVAASGPGVAAGTITFTPDGEHGPVARGVGDPARDDAGEAPDEIEQRAVGADDQGQAEAAGAKAEAEGVDPDAIADEAAPSGTDPAVQGAGEDAGSDVRSERAPGSDAPTDSGQGHDAVTAGAPKDDAAHAAAEDTPTDPTTDEGDVR